MLAFVVGLYVLAFGPWARRTFSSFRREGADSSGGYELAKREANVVSREPMQLNWLV